MKTYYFLVALLFVLIVRPVFAEDLEKNLRDQVVELTEQEKAAGPRFELSGELEKGKNSRYSINGEDFDVDDMTEIYGEKTLSLGKNVRANGFIRNGKKLADQVLVQEKSSSFVPPDNEAPLRSLDSSDKRREPGPVE